MGIWYRAGTISVTNGTADLTGSGTAWVANVSPGMMVVYNREIIGEVQAVNSDTSITLAIAYAGMTISGGEYAIANLGGVRTGLTAAVQKALDALNDAQDRTIQKYNSRADYIAAGVTPVTGETYMIDGLTYKGLTGATAIGDLPGLVPLGPIYDDHFGTAGNLTWEDNGEGPERLTGSDDSARIRAALDYAVSVGLGIVHCRSDLYLTGEISFPDGAALVWTTNFANTVWLDFGERESGFELVNRNKLTGVNIIMQHNTAGKEANRGDEGNAIRIGGEFFSNSPQTTKTGFYIDVKITLAADVPGQNSYPSPEVSAIHNIDGAFIRLGSYTTSNVRSSYKYLSHWSGYNGTGNSQLEPTGTYHARNVTLRWNGTISGCVRVVGLSAVAMHDIRGFTCDGVRMPVLILAGDNTDKFTVADQVGLPGKGIRFGFIHARNCETLWGEECILVTSQGTSKWDEYDGTSIKKVDQLALDVKFDGAWIGISEKRPAITGVTNANPAVVTAPGHGFSNDERISIDDVVGMLDLNGNSYVVRNVTSSTFELLNTDSTNFGVYTSGGIAGYGIRSTAIRGFGIHGNCDFGTVWETGADQSSLEIEFGNGQVSFNLMSGTAELRVENRRNTTILGSAVDYGEDFQTDYCVRITGTTYTSTLGSAATKGDTTITLASGFSENVSKGDKILVGVQPVTATEFIKKGVTELQVTPLLADVASGTVTLDLRTTVDRFVASFHGSEKGSLLDYADVDHADYTNVAVTGRNLGVLENTASVMLEGTIPAVSSEIPTTGDYAFVLNPGCVASLLPRTRVPHNSATTATFQLQRGGTGGPWAQLIASGAIIQNVSNLYSASDPIRQVKLQDCTNFDGDEVDSPHHAAPWSPLIERSTSGGTGITTTIDYAYYLVMGPFIEVDFKLTITTWPSTTGAEHVLLKGFPADMFPTQVVTGSLAVDNGDGALSVPGNDLYLRTNAAESEAWIFRQASSGVATVKDDEILDENILWGNLRYRWR
ncbi:ubiquitin-activating E1 FCCH domain-containing protein [uncultured Roseovarius sp.]|uniref:ubiquitin-activating E1 FCCH domain-containing protein n=1 Tax=uncultured Roseovarius sp. TaxID=293344 RepID=UPI0026115533|nr:ubiquitin-activating E1 FCCH domain-containing protein [uncultured Roseovarius sp.]